MNTADRILDATRHQLAAHGIRKLSVADVALAAAVTRTTVYRYFPNRDSLIRHAIIEIPGLFENALDGTEAEAGKGLEAYLGGLGEAVGLLPPGIPRVLESLESALPEVHREFRERLRLTIRTIFDTVYTVAEREGRIRPGVNRRVIEVLFWDAVSRLGEHAMLRDQGISPADVYATLITTMLHGIVTKSNDEVRHTP